MDGNDKDLSKQFEDAGKRPVKPVIYVDVELYQHHLAGLGLTPDQEREIIIETWNLMMGFIDGGFEIRVIEKACGQDENGHCVQDKSPSDGVDYDHTDLEKTHDNAPGAD